MARKVVGVGSVGTRVWIIAPARSPAMTTSCSCRPRRREASVLERFTKKSAYANHGARVVAGPAPHAGEPATSSWAGTATDGIDGRDPDYYIRQLQDWKGSMDTENAIPQG